MPLLLYSISRILQSQCRKTGRESQKSELSSGCRGRKKAVNQKVEPQERKEVKVHEKKREQMKLVRELYSQGNSPEDIAEGVGLSVYTVKEYLDCMGISCKEFIKLPFTEKIQRAAKRIEIEAFKARLNPGDEVIVVQEEQDGHKVIRRMRHAVIVSVSKHVILTDCGCFQDKEVYLWQGLKKQ